MISCKHLIVFINLLLSCFSLAAQEAVVKNQVVIKTARKYKGNKIETILLTEDGKGLVAKTKDGKGYFLNRDEAKEELDIMLTGKGFILPKDASATYYDQNGVPSDSFRNDDYAKTNGKVYPFRAKAFQIYPGTDTTKKPLWLINNREASKEEALALSLEAIENVNVLNRDTALQRYGEKGRDGVVLITLKEVVAKDTIKHIDIVATFPGGIQAWRRYIEQNLQYPVEAQKAGIKGRVKVRTTVQKDGSLSAEPITKLGYGLEEEAVRVVKLSPKWNPATRDGVLVTYRFDQTPTFNMQ